MAQSVVTDNIDKTQTISHYGYDAFGRRTLVQDEGFATMRTLYDGHSFDIIRENEVFGGGDFTTNYIQGSGIEFTTGEVTGGRYRNIDGYSVEKTRFTGTKVALYANGESVGVNRFSSNGDSSGRAYFGTDILGSVRSATTDGARLEDRYEYDAFGTPYKGDFSTGLDGGYTGKPYDATTGLYNYGYRDYNPQTARVTTVDPIRDGNNWFSYVVNDPVNYVDLWGLSASDAAATTGETDEPLAEVRNGIAPPIGATFDAFSDFGVSSQWGPDREPIETENGTTQPGHGGTDFPAPEGTRVNAVMSGTVTEVSSEGGLGNHITITHPAGNNTQYAHLSEGSTLVTVGQEVEAGEKIAEVGSTGNSTGNHLHLGYDANGNGDYSDAQDNPLSFLGGGGGG